MRQAGSQVVAPLDSVPRWPDGYVVMLQEAGAVEKIITFLVAWMRRFFAQFAGWNQRDLGRPEIEAFLAHLRPPPPSLPKSRSCSVIRCAPRATP